MKASDRKPNCASGQMKMDAGTTASSSSGERELKGARSPRDVALCHPLTNNQEENSRTETSLVPSVSTGRWTLGHWWTAPQSADLTLKHRLSDASLDMPPRRQLHLWRVSLLQGLLNHTTPVSGRCASHCITLQQQGGDKRKALWTRSQRKRQRGLPDGWVQQCSSGLRRGG